MSEFGFVLCFLSLSFSVGRCSLMAAEALPSWITNNPGYTNRKEVNSVEAGCGALSSKEKTSAGWVVTLNDVAGHGVEIEVEKLSTDPDKEEFLLVSPWPLTGNFKRIKLYTGKFSEPLKKLRIPNTKTFYVLYSVSQTSNSPEMVLKYSRYGSPLELIYPPPEDPNKKKKTLYEIQLKGKAPEEYRPDAFLNQVKEAIRASAKRYCEANDIPFDDSRPTSQMVRIHRIRFCPFEWPERDICTSLEHSVFASGVRIPNQEIVLDYELTADNLKRMWMKDDFPELQALGVTVLEVKPAEEELKSRARKSESEGELVKKKAEESLPPMYQLPSTSSITMYWSAIIALVLVSALIITLILRKIFINRTKIVSSRMSVETDEVVKVKRPKMKLNKLQRVPSFIYNQRHPRLVQLENHLQNEISEQKALSEQMALRAKQESASEREKPSQNRILNYGGSVFFGDNKAFDDDGDETVEYRKKTHL